MAMGLGVMVMLGVVLLGLLGIGLVVGGVALNRRHRREDEARADDRVNGP